MTTYSEILEAAMSLAPTEREELAITLFESADEPASDDAGAVSAERDRAAFGSLQARRPNSVALEGRPGGGSPKVLGPCLAPRFCHRQCAISTRGTRGISVASLERQSDLPTIVAIAHNARHPDFWRGR
jgi:hypothetical protein